MTLAHRMIVMNGGVAEQVGTPQEVYDKPATMFVANFIGSPPMNLLQGRVVEGGRAFEHAGGRVALPAVFAELDGRELVLGVRPEHVRLMPATAADALALFDVDTVEGLGPDYLVHGRMLGQNVVFREDRESFIPQAGEKAAMTFAAKGIHWFDPKTKKAHRPLKRDCRLLFNGGGARCEQKCGRSARSRPNASALGRRFEESRFSRKGTPIP